MTDPKAQYTSGPRVFVRDEHRAYVQLDCRPRKDADGNDLVGGHCRFRLTRGPAVNGSPADQHWHWDGNVDVPTISPSIDCTSCKKHVTIVQGAER